MAVGGALVRRVRELHVAPTRGLARITHRKIGHRAWSTDNRSASVCAYGGGRRGALRATSCVLACSDAEQVQYSIVDQAFSQDF
jgi:hypothetical protein